MAEGAVYEASEGVLMPSAESGIGGTVNDSVWIFGNSFFLRTSSALHSVSVVEADRNASAYSEPPALENSMVPVDFWPRTPGMTATGLDIRYRRALSSL